LLIQNAATILTCAPSEGDLAGRIQDGCVAIAGESILAVGPTREVLAAVDASQARVLDAGGKIVAPGFVDSHTHLVFGGSRVREYAARLTRGLEEVRQAGLPTGIWATVEMTRSTGLDELTRAASRRLARMLRHGTTTVESKSGYGLSLAGELRQLEVNQRLRQIVPQDVVSTFLGAHAFPADMPHGDYIDLVVEEMIPAVAERGLAEFCDVYCDEGYFSLAQSRRILTAALAAGMKLKVHADQYSALGAADLAAELGAVSADHLNYTGPETMSRLAAAGVVGVLMPAIDFAVQHPHPFDARAMLGTGMHLALATDLCPGGWTESMQLVMQLACRLHRLSPEEALLAATVGGARALALDDRGALAPGMLADIQIWDLPSFEDVIYRLGNNAVETVIKRGRVVVQSKAADGFETA
jgi:imidazolonepropionase